MIADILTLFRVVITFIIFGLAISGSHNLTLFVVLALIAWTTDNLDGWFARRSEKYGKLAHLDFAADITLVISCFFFIISLGYYSTQFFVVYAIVLIATAFVVGSKALIISFELPLLLLILRAIYKEAPSLILLILLWAIISLILHYGRFKRGIAEYKEGIKEIFRGFTRR